MPRSTQPRRFAIGLAVAALSLVLAGPTLAGGTPLAGPQMTGAQEAPMAGDPDGTGSATFTLNQGRGQVCFSWTVQDIALPVTGSHIHIAPPGEPGPVVVPLTGADADGVASGCVTASKGLIKAIRQNPGAYYVNVHNDEYPGGAVRDQLEK